MKISKNVLKKEVILVSLTIIPNALEFAQDLTFAIDSTRQQSNRKTLKGKNREVSCKLISLDEGHTLLIWLNSKIFAD